VARRPKEASREKTRPPPVSRGSSPRATSQKKNLSPLRSRSRRSRRCPPPVEVVIIVVYCQNKMPSLQTASSRGCSVGSPDRCFQDRATLLRPSTTVPPLPPAPSWRPSNLPRGSQRFGFVNPFRPGGFTNFG